MTSDIQHDENNQRYSLFRQLCFQAFALATMSRSFVHGKPGRFETTAHGPGDSERGKTRAHARSFRNLRIQCLGPHAFILGRAEPIQKPSIRLEAAGWQHLGNIPKMQSQADAIIRPDHMTCPVHGPRPDCK